MLKLADYDQTITLATSHCGKWGMYAAQYGKVWRFVIEHKTSSIDSGAVGRPYSSKMEILNDAYHYMTELSGYSSVLPLSTFRPIVKTVRPVLINNDQIVAINTAIQLLGNSRSDHAEQCVFHLNTIIESLN